MGLHFLYQLVVKVSGGGVGVAFTVTIFPGSKTNIVDGVAAAIARAKAKKAQQAENAPAAPEFELENSSHNEPDAQAIPEASANAPESSDDKQDRVATAIARAKAKRAAREQQSKNNEQDD